MIKTVVIPENNDLHLTVPNNYIGKEIEVLLYSKEEVLEGKNGSKKDAARFKGFLTNAEAEKFHVYLNQARSEWDRDI